MLTKYVLKLRTYFVNISVLTPKKLLESKTSIRHKSHPEHMLTSQTGRRCDVMCLLKASWTRSNCIRRLEEKPEISSLCPNPPVSAHVHAAK